MNTPAVSTLELRAIDTVLEMGGGYVLDFTDRTFAEFFRDHGVQIDDPQYSAEGGSKAKRLRYFLRITPPPLSGKVLAGLLEYRFASSAEVDPGAWDSAVRVAVRLGGVPPSGEQLRSSAAAAMTEQELLARSLRPEAVAGATRDPAMAAIVLDRLQEAERCIGVEAYLAAVILAGSVLEALCLDFGTQHPERVNRAFRAAYNKPPPKLHEWHLRQWIDVLGSTGDLSPNIKKFGHGLRDFRNYVHPAQQRASGFRLDKHTAVISLRVVVAAIDDLGAAYARLGTATPKDLARLKTPVLLRTERKLTDAGIGQISSGLLPAGTVLMSSRAPIGYLAITEVPVAINQGFIAMKPRPGVSGLFLLLWAASSQDQILSRANGSTFLEISKSSFRPIEVLAPPADAMASFDRVVRPIHERVVANERQIGVLAEIRDALVPRLLSGQLTP